MFVTEDVHIYCRFVICVSLFIVSPILLVVSIFISMSLLNAFCDFGYLWIFSIILSLVCYLVILLNDNYDKFFWNTDAYIKPVRQVLKLEYLGAPVIKSCRLSCQK